MAKKFADRGIETVGDLLLSAPRRLDHWGKLTPIARLREGEDVTILAEVLSARLVPNRSRKGVRFEVALTDGTDNLTATFFAANEYKLIPHRRLLVPGASFLFAGKIGAYRGRLQLTHPQFEGADDAAGEEELRQRSDRPIPIYSGAKGVASWTVARLVGMVLDGLDDAAVPDAVPADVRDARGLLPYAQALRQLHRPETDDDWAAAKATLAWHEAFVLQAALVRARRDTAHRKAPKSKQRGNAVRKEFLEALPFKLTEAQSAAIKQITTDLTKDTPMQRLLQGDVGSGKTVVALAAMCQVVGAGHQAALLAPTEILAEQHWQSIDAFLAPLRRRGMDVDVRLLTGSTKAAARREITAGMASGKPMIVVGTHALIQKDIEFGDLGLVIVDEQHRFGVAQRDRLRDAGGAGAATPHQLVMTATPIPRSVAMTVFGDLDETRMEGMPPGRTPVKTFLVDAANTGWMARMWQRAREEVDAGGRVYVVCPAIDAKDATKVREAEDKRLAAAGQEALDLPGGAGMRPPLASVGEVAAQLREGSPLAGLGIAELHGKLPAAEKEQIMGDFAAGRSPVVVATTVVEVGVDVSEASMMIILDAQQFGLSQLHQLRGRVGRGSRPSVCMAVHAPGIGGTSLARLQAFAGTTDGFELAQADLALRSEGDVLGAEQSGHRSGLRFLSVRRDEAVIEQARAAAEGVLDGDPTLAGHPALADAVRRRSGEELQWMERS